MKHITAWEWALLGAILVYSLVPVAGGLLRIAELAGGTGVVPENPRAIADPLPITLHILSSIVFCLVGAVQFLPSLRRRFPALHRRAGRIVAAAGVTSALTGLWMTLVFALPPELQGPLLYWVRIGLSGAMVGLILWAVSTIRVGDRFGHRAAMLRAYAIGQGASTQAVMGIGAVLIAGEDIIGFERDILMVSAWALNLMIAQVLIRTGRRHGPALA